MESTLLRLSLGLTVLLAAALLGGCPPEEFGHALPTTLTDVTRIVDDTTLTDQEKRVQLEGLGLSPSTINAFLQAQRTGNQFGGDLRSAYDKVVGNRLTALTPDEVQIYGDEAGAADKTLTATLNDEQAQAVVTFFSDFGISSRDELTAFLDTPGQTVPSLIPDGVLRALFVNFDSDLLLPRLP